MLESLILSHQPEIIEDYKKIILYELPKLVKNDDLDKLLNIVKDGNIRHLNIIFDCIVTPRNYMWIPRMIENSKKYKKVLYVVGAAHLPGPEGLIELLKKEGFTVTKK
jgi:uncharacterized protein YbaP (TraB family)